MLKLYYINKNQVLGVMELSEFDKCIPLPENLIFVAYRDGLQFIKEPPQTFPFTDVERLIMGSEFFDMRYLKDSDFRKENSSFCRLVPPLVPPLVPSVKLYEFTIYPYEDITLKHLPFFTFPQYMASGSVTNYKSQMLEPEIEGNYYRLERIDLETNETVILHDVPKPIEVPTPILRIFDIERRGTNLFVNPAVFGTLKVHFSTDNFNVVNDSFELDVSPSPDFSIDISIYENSLNNGSVMSFEFKESNTENFRNLIRQDWTSKYTY